MERSTVLEISGNEHTEREIRKWVRALAPEHQAYIVDTEAEYDLD